MNTDECLSAWKWSLFSCLNQRTARSNLKLIIEAIRLTSSPVKTLVLKRNELPVRKHSFHSDRLRVTARRGNLHGNRSPGFEIKQMFSGFSSQYPTQSNKPRAMLNRRNSVAVKPRVELLMLLCISSI